jgi:hypothetical protein
LIRFVLTLFRHVQLRMLQTIDGKEKWKRNGRGRRKQRTLK